MENAPKFEKKQDKLGRILDFLERQQALHRQDKQERQRRIDEEEHNRKEHLRKYWRIYILIAFAIFTFIFVLASLENRGII